MREREDLEEELEIYKNRLERAMQAGNLAWWEMELPSGEVDFNDRKAEMLGYSPERFEHYSDFTDLLHPEDYERAMQAMRDHIEGEAESYEVEYRIEKKDGSYKWFRDVGRVTEKEENYTKVTGVVIDIDERKRAEERESFLHSLLRHDLRNKLEITMGYGQLLKEKDLDEEAEELLGKDWNAKQETLQLIERVRKLREALDEELKSVDLYPVLESTVEKYGLEAENRDMKIELQDFGFTVKGGEFLDELFSNLVINSIKHSEGNLLRIWADRIDDEVRVIVEDDGVGVPDDEKENIFEKGYRRGSGGGSGLGLYFVREIAKSYGGNVEVKDSDLGGARFDVYLEKV